jgi:hypothetical protein
MTNVQLLQLAQSTAAQTVIAAPAVIGPPSAFATVKAAISAFEGTGNPDTDWPSFHQNVTQEVQRYKAASDRDKAPAAASGGGLPADLLARLPANVKAALAKAAPAAAPAAPAPPPVAAAPKSE